MKKFAALTLLTFAIVTVLYGSASADIKLTDNLTLNGFLDMSAVITSSKVKEDGKETTKTTASGNFDQFELDFLFDYGSTTARVDIDSTGDGSGMKLEQGFVTYNVSEDILPGASITAGRFLSTFGWEAAEPTGLYQYSVSEGIPYPGYQNGVAVSIAPVKEISIYAALLTGVWDVADTDLKNPGIETQVTLTPIEEVTAKVGFALDDTGEGDARTEVNAWVSFTEGPLTLAGEFDLLGNWPSASAVDTAGNPLIRKDGIHYLGMASVSLADVISAPIGVTVRFSGVKLDEEDTSTEITFSPSFTANDNWLLLAEVKRRIDAEETIFAFESLFTF
jgi:hypothetical protein